MNIDILPVPVFEGCDIKGVDQAPQILIKSGAVDIFNKHHDVTVLDPIEFKKITGASVFKSDKDIKYKDQILEMTTQICDKISRSILKGNFPITIGGDHSLGMGTVAGNSKANLGKISVIWFDAHPDINTPETSPSKNFHGMSFASAMGYGDKDICDVGFKGAKVKTENSYLMGIRAIDSGERKMIEDCSVFNLKSSDINSMGAAVAVDKLMAEIDEKDMDSIHFSIDVDVVTPEDMFAVNVPEPNGLSLSDAIIIIKKIVSHPKVKSVDFVEYNPLIEKDGKSLQNCLKMLDAISDSLANR